MRGTRRQTMTQAKITRKQAIINDLMDAKENRKRL
jgi:hypothetical protein